MKVFDTEKSNKKIITIRNVNNEMLSRMRKSDSTNFLIKRFFYLKRVFKSINKT